jgi:hypothetical protein
MGGSEIEGRTAETFMNSHRPSLKRIIDVDYTAQVSVLFPPVSWGICLVLTILQGSDFAFSSITALAVTIISLSVLIWRVRTLYSVFADGFEVPAIIHSVSFFRGRGRVEYVYTYQGQKYLSGNAVQKTRWAEALKVGDQVIVVVDRKKPKRAFIRDLYL